MRTIGPAVSEKIFEIVDDDGRTPEHVYTESSPMSLRLRRANETSLFSFTHATVTCFSLSLYRKLWHFKREPMAFLGQDLTLAAAINAAENTIF